MKYSELEKKLKKAQMKVVVLIEKGLDGTYDAHFGEDTDLSLGLLGQGNTVQEAIDDFYAGKDEMKALYQDLGKSFPEDLEFEFKYDLPSFLRYYSKILSLAGLERLTGVNQGQLSHYISGYRKPGRKTTEKIEKALHQFGKEISQVEFV